MDVKQVLLDNYLPYSIGTIVDRAIPSIDGLKPAQRRILYTMYKMGLLVGAKRKSSNIVGEVMKIHPHGDMAIYETMVRMATGNESLNAPYVESKGNFGKVYSKDLAFAAPRYTEAKLSAIAAELFDGIDEDAVEFINNFDDTTTEPTLLPVKFPSVLVNTSSGIAVSTSSNIPSFDLTAVCKSTIGILKGEITTHEKLMEVLGTPDFSTGGTIHASDEDLVNLSKTGRGSFVMTGTVTTYKDKIVITEIPYRTNAEAIMEAITEYARTGELREVSDVSDEIDLHGFKVVVELKRGSNSQDVLAKLYRYTPLQTSMGFNTRVLLNNRAEEIGIFELLERWIEFRMATVKRVHQFRLNKDRVQEELLKAWEKIGVDIREVARIITSMTEEEAKKEIQRRWGLNDAQVEFILETKIRMFTLDNLEKKLRELEKVRNAIAMNEAILESDASIKELIINDLIRIIQKYPSERKCIRGEKVVITYAKEEIVIDDSPVKVLLTKSGYIKRLATNRMVQNFTLPAGEEVIREWDVKNDEYLLVFTTDGECHKILVDSIDATREGLKDRLVGILNLEGEDKVAYVDAAGDFSGHFNIVYPNGRGYMVYYDKVSGKRSVYKGMFDKVDKGRFWITQSDEFFMVTGKKKAAHVSLVNSIGGSRAAFKVARVGDDDGIIGLVPVDRVPNMERINIQKYNKGYTVLIGDDRLW